MSNTIGTSPVLPIACRIVWSLARRRRHGDMSTRPRVLTGGSPQGSLRRVQRHDDKERDATMVARVRSYPRRSYRQSHLGSLV